MELRHYLPIPQRTSPTSTLGITQPSADEEVNHLEWISLTIPVSEVKVPLRTCLTEGNVYWKDV